MREVPEVEWATYAPIAGTPDFLRAVIDDVLATEPELQRSAVAAATPGGSGALRHAIANFLEPGQALLTTSYYWGPYQTLADEAERKVATFPMFAADGGIDVEGFDRALSKIVEAQGRALIILNDPCHNPTGYSMRPGEWAAIAQRVRAHGERAPVTLVVDCAYSAYGPNGLRGVLPELAKLRGVVPVVFAWSASKTFTHYGLRVGAIIACLADEKERKMTEAALSYSCRGTWSNCTRGGLVAVTRLLSDPELRAACNAEREGLRAKLLARVARWNELARARGLVYPRYEGGFFVTVFREDAFEKAEAMRKRGVYVVPQKGALRVALCSTSEEEIPRLVGAIAE